MEKQAWRIPLYSHNKNVYLGSSLKLQAIHRIFKLFAKTIISGEPQEKKKITKIKAMFHCDISIDCQKTLLVLQVDKLS